MAIPMVLSVGLHVTAFKFNALRRRIHTRQGYFEKKLEPRFGFYKFFL